MPIQVKKAYSYSLRWEPNDPTSATTSPPAREPSAAMVEMLPGPLDSFGEASRVDEWDTLLNDMIEFSRLLPNHLFAIYCKEWIENDDWVMYFLNGYWQERGATIVHDLPAKEKWREQ